MAFLSYESLARKERGGAQAEPSGPALGRPALANRAAKRGAGGAGRLVGLLECGQAFGGVKVSEQRPGAQLAKQKETQENLPWLRGFGVTGPC